MRPTLEVQAARLRPPRQPRVFHHAGFALLELMLAVSVSALIALYASAQIAREAEESLAEGSAQYLRAVAAAVEQHVLLHFNEYANGIDIPGVATDVAPTVAELVALGRLN